MNEQPETREELEQKSIEFINIAKGNWERSQEKLSDINSDDVKLADHFISIIEKVTKINDHESYINYLVWNLSNLDGAFQEKDTRLMDIIGEMNLYLTLSETAPADFVISLISQMTRKDNKTDYKIVQNNYAKLLVQIPWVVCTLDLVSSLPLFTTIQNGEGTLADGYVAETTQLAYQFTSNPVDMMDMCMEPKQRSKHIFKSDYFLQMDPQKRDEVKEQYISEYNKAKSIYTEIYLELFSL